MFTRKYRSKTGLRDQNLHVDNSLDVFGVDGPLGHNWTHSYNIQVEFRGINILGQGQGCAGEIRLLDGSGRVTWFQINSPSNCPPSFGPLTPVEYRADGYAATVVLTPDELHGYEKGTAQLQFADGSTYHFGAFDGQYSTAKIQQIVDRNGNSMQFEYDTSGRLDLIIDTLDREYVLTYDGSSQRISTVTDFAGRAWTYQYYGSSDPDGNEGDLKSVTSPAVVTSDGFAVPSEHAASAGTWTYGYHKGTGHSDTNLKSITDANGITILENTYDSQVTDRIIRQVHGGEQYDFEYSVGTSSSGSFYRTISTNRSGFVKELRFNSMNNLIYQADFTGRRTDRSQPVGDPANWTSPNKVRSSDPGGFIREWTRNQHFKLTSYQTDEGDSIANVYDTSGGERRIGNLLESTRTPGSGRGSPITEYWRYHADLGSVDSCGCGSSFATFHQDGNGNRRYSRFDGHGNLIMRFIDLPPFEQGNDILSDPTIDTHDVDPGTEDLPYVEEFTYDSHGRLLSHSHPFNGTHHRLDVYTYHSDTDQHLGRRGQLASITVDAAAQSPLTALALTTTFDYNPVGQRVLTVSPMGRISRSVYDHRDRLVVSEQRDPTGAVVLASMRRFYDANGNVLREDTANLDQDGQPLSPAWLSTLHAYDVLNYRTLTVRQTGGQALTTSDLDAAQLVTDNRFIAVAYEHDQNKNLSKIIRPTAMDGSQPDNVVEMMYDERDLLYQVRRGDPTINPDIVTISQRDYDGNGKLMALYEGMISPSSTSGATVSLFEYDGHDRVTSATDALGNETLIEYDSNHNRTKIERYGQLVSGSGSNVLLSRELYAYDELDRPTQVGNRWFDATTGSLIQGGSEYVQAATVYNPDSSVHQRIDARGLETTFTYDTAGRLVGVTDPGLNTTLYEYSDDGDPVKTTVSEKGTNAFGTPLTEVFETTSQYDDLGRQVLVADNRGNITELIYDSRGNLVATLDPRGNVVVHEYDGLSRPVSTTRTMTDTGLGGGTAVGTITTSQAWDADSRLVQQIDDNSNATTYTYDALGRPVATIYADGTQDEVAAYDVRGNPLTIETARGHTISTAYDLLNRPTLRQVTGGPTVGNGLDTTVEAYSYDGLSRLLTAADNDTLVSRTYDSLSRLLTESLQFGTLSVSGSPPAASWTGLGSTAVTTYQHDVAGNTTTILYPGGRVVTRTIDAAFDRIARIDAADDSMSTPALVAEFGYIGPGRPLVRKLANGLTTTYTYDGVKNDSKQPSDSFGLGLPRSIDHVELDTGTVVGRVDRREFRWDRSQNKSRVSRIMGIQSGGLGAEDRRWVYGYDSIDRLVHSTATLEPSGTTIRDEVYNLDGVHNRTTVTGGPSPGSYLMSDHSSFMDLEVNQYTRFTPTGGGSPQEFRHDVGGNLIDWSPRCGGDANGDHKCDGADLSVLTSMMGQSVSPPGSGADFNFDGVVNGADLSILLSSFGTSCAYNEASYDYRNRMVEFRTRLHGSTDPDVHRYHYDALDRRVRKVTHATDESDIRTTVFLHGGEWAWQLLEERDGQDGSGDPVGVGSVVLATYIHSGGYVDDVVSMRHDPEASGSGGDAIDPPLDDYFFHHDDLYSAVALTDSSGDVVERYDYHDYGHTAFQRPDGTPNRSIDRSDYGNRLTFTGRELDPESGLMMYRTRYYHPGMGRFTTRDRIGTWGDRTNLGNASALVGASPLCGVDPFGLMDPGWTRLPGVLGNPERKPRRQHAAPQLPVPIDRTYTSTPDTIGERWPMPGGTRDLPDTFEKFVEELEREFQRTGCCLRLLQIDGHAGGAGKCVVSKPCKIGDPSEIFNAPLHLQRLTSPNEHDRKHAEKQRELWQRIGRLMCPEARLQIVQCGAGEDERGDALRDAIQEYIGHPVDVWPGDVKWSPAAPFIPGIRNFPISSPYHSKKSKQSLSCD